MKRFIFIIIFISFAIRLIYIVLLPQKDFVRPILDQKIYYELAAQLISGKGFVCPTMETVTPEKLQLMKTRKAIIIQAVQKGYFRGVVPIGKPTAFWLPLYPIFIGIILILFGKSFIMIRIVQAIVGSLVILPAYLITRQLFDKSAAKIASILICFWPFYIYFTGVLMTETLYIFFLTLFVFLSLRGLTDKRLIISFLAGFVGGLTLLTRSVVLGLLPFGMIPFLINIRISKKRKTAILLYLLGILIVITPWAIRNYRQFNVIQILPTKGGPTFWARNNPLFLAQELSESKLGFSIEKYRNDEALNFPKFTKENEIQRNKILFKRMFHFILNNPIVYLRLCLLKFIWFISPFGGSGTALWKQIISLLTYGITLFFALYELVYIEKFRYKRSYFLLAVVFYFIIFHTIINGDTRFRIPLDIFLIMLASPSYNRIKEWFQKRLISLTSFHHSSFPHG